MRPPAQRLGGNRCTALDGRDDHVRLNPAAHRAIAMALRDCLRRALDRHSQQPGIARLDFAA